MWASRRSSAGDVIVPDRTAVIAAGDGIERAGAVAAVLDQIVPPSFGVGLAGRRRQLGQRIDRRPAIVEHADLVRWGRGQRVRQRQVDRLDRRPPWRGPSGPPATPG